MAVLTLADIRTRVYNNLNRDDIPDSADGLIDRWINDAQRRVCRSYNFSFMETEATLDTTDEQQTYALPAAGDTTWTEILSGTVLRYKSELSLQLIDSDDERVSLVKAFKQDIDQKGAYSDTGDSGTPKHYAIQRQYIYLYPKPDHADNNGSAWSMRFEYYGFLTELSGNSATNFLVANFPELLEAIATSKGFKYIKELDAADYWEKQATALFQEAVKEDEVNVYGTLEEGLSIQPGSGTGMGGGYSTALARWVYNEDAAY